MELKRIMTYKDFVGELKVTYSRTKLATKKITSYVSAAEFMKPYFNECMDDHEEVKVLHLNRNNCVVNVMHHTVGSDVSSIVSVKKILQDALLIKTVSIIMFHNHPSGSLKASNEDISTSKKIKKACEYLDINFLDSIILTKESYYSLSNNDLL